MQVLCRRLLDALELTQWGNDGDDDDDDDDGNSVGRSEELDLPPPTLSRDLSSMLGDSNFADIRFIAEGKDIYAHRFILEARCEYFRAMFRSGMSEADQTNRNLLGVATVVVPDSYVGFLRLLVFIYTSTLPDGSDTSLLEDFITADRYGVSDMKLLCESMLMPTSHNWIDVFRIANAIGSERLKTEVLGYLRDNVSELTTYMSHHSSLFADDEDASEASSFFRNSQRLNRAGETIPELPDVLDVVMAMRREAYPQPPSQILVERSAQLLEKTNSFGADTKVSFPWMGILGGIAFVVGYPYVANKVFFGPLMPLFNVIVIASMMYFVFYYYLNR